MISLAIKYRPTTWDDLTEQESIKKILSYQLETNTIKNAYLFTGPAGTGKTTSARIFANMINGGKGTPIELDAASNNGVDDIRRICDEAQTRSLDSEYKVFILDEVHVLSGSAWQAMLKTLEEPPVSSVFILCTTNPEKIPATILSRVQRYNFQRISTKGIEHRLTEVLNREQSEANQFYNIEPEAISYISRIASGGMRDALSLLDKCLSYSNELTVANVVLALGVADYDTMISLTSAVISQDFQGVLQILEDIYNAGVDLTQFVKTYFEFFLDVCKYTITDDMDIIKIPRTYQDTLDHWRSIEMKQPQYLKFLVELLDGIKWEKNVKAYVEAKFLLYVDSCSKGLV